MPLEDIPLHEEKQPVKQAETLDLNIPIDVQAELYLQYHNAKRLFVYTESDPDTPTNQKAQVLNTLAAILAQITKTQTELHSIQRVRAIEETLIAILKEQSEEFRQTFMNLYEAKLAELSR